MRAVESENRAANMEGIGVQAAIQNSYMPRVRPSGLVSGRFDRAGAPQNLSPPLSPVTTDDGDDDDDDDDANDKHQYQHNDSNRQRPRDVQRRLL